MVAEKSTVNPSPKLVLLQQQIAALEKEIPSLEKAANRLRRSASKSFASYDRYMAASEALIAAREKITRLYNAYAREAERFIVAREKAAAKAEAKPKPKKKVAPEPKKPRVRKPTKKEQAAAAERERRERDEAERLERQAEERRRILAEEEARQREQAKQEARDRALAKKRAKAEREKERRRQAKVEREFAKSPEQRLEEQRESHPLKTVEKPKGTTYKSTYGKLPPVESVNWRDVLTTVSEYFVDQWGIVKRLQDSKRQSNEQLISRMKKSDLLEVLNKYIQFRNFNIQKGKLPRLVGHLFANDYEAGIARMYTGVELTYPDGMLPYAWIFVPNPDAPYHAEIINGHLRIEQPISEIDETFIPFTTKQMLNPALVAEEVYRLYPDAIAAMIRSGAFGVVRKQGKYGRGDTVDDRIDSLTSAIMFFQAKYSRDSDDPDIAALCDPDDPNSKWWGNWMTGIVTFRAKSERDYQKYLAEYNKLMDIRREARKASRAAQARDDRAR